MRILLLTDGIHPYVLGGMQMHSVSLVKHLALNGCNVTIVHCTNGSDIPHSEEVRKNILGFHYEDSVAKRIEVVYHEFPQISKIPGHYVLESYLYSKRIFKNIQKRLDEFDLIYAQGFTGWYFLRIKNEIRPEIWVNFHGLNMFQNTYGLTATIESWVLKPFVALNLRNASKVISLGGELTAILRRFVSSNNILEFPNGIEQEWLISHWELKEKPQKEFIFIGRNDKVKGLDILYDVLLDLERKREKIKLNIVGPIDPDKNLVSLKYVKLVYHGKILDSQSLRALIDKSSFLVLPSRSEGMPTAVLEAMSRGLFIISTNVGAVKAMVNQEFSILIDVNNKNQLELAIKQVLEIPPDKLLEKGVSAIFKAEKEYLWIRIASRMVDIIKGKEVA